MPSSPNSTPAPGAWCRASGTRRMPGMRSTSSSSITCGSPGLRFAAGHLHHAQFVGVQLQGGELAAPDRAGVDGMHAMADEQAQRAPVAADDLQVALGAAGDFVPGIQAGLLRAGRVLFLERDPPARRAVAHAGEAVDDRALAVQAHYRKSTSLKPSPQCAYRMPSSACKKKTNTAS